MSNSANNSIPFVPENTIDPAAGLNEAINSIDSLLQLAVLTVNGNAPPANPAEGDRHIVGQAPAGAWAGKAGQVARFLDGFWSFYAARWALSLADSHVYVRAAGAWALLEGVSNLVIKDEGASVGKPQALNFAGTGVSVTDNGDGTVTVTISGGSGGDGMANPMTAALDMIIGGLNGAPLRLAGPSTDGMVLTRVAGAIAWATASAGGGMSNPMTAKGDLILGGDSGAPARLGIGTAGQVLTVVAGSLAWVTPSGGGGGGFTGGTLTSALNEAPPAVSNGSSALLAVSNAANTLYQNGQGPITGLEELPIGSKRTVIFNTARSLVNSATFKLLGGADVAITAGDSAVFICEAVGVWRMLSYSRAGGGPLISNSTFTTPINQANRVSIPAAGLVNGGGATSDNILITGSANINQFGAAPDGARRVFTFESAGSVLVHTTYYINAITGTNITARAGDSFEVVNTNGGQEWRMLWYQRADGTALVSAGGGSAGALLLDGTSRMTGPINQAPKQTVSVVGTKLDLGASSDFAEASGGTNIDQLGLAPAGARRLVNFTGPLLLEHGSQIILPTGANITTANGDHAQFICTGEYPPGYGRWVCVSYMRGSGQPLMSAPASWAGGTLTAAINEAPLATIQSASALPLGANTANTYRVTGTASINSGTAAPAGTIRRLIFDEQIYITNDPVKWIFPGLAGSALIRTMVGDIAEMVSLGSGNWKCFNYLRADGFTLGSISTAWTNTGASGGWGFGPTSPQYRKSTDRVEFRGKVTASVALAANTPRAFSTLGAAFRPIYPTEGISENVAGPIINVTTWGVAGITVDRAGVLSIVSPVAIAAGETFDISAFSYSLLAFE